MPIRILVNDEVRAERTLPRGAYVFEIELHGVVQEVGIETAGFVPRAEGVGQDARRLGIFVEEITLR